MICCKTNTVCPKCQHQFPVQWSTGYRGRPHDMMSGGGLIETALSPLQSPEPASISFFISPALNIPNVAAPPSPSAVTPAPQVVHVVHHHHHHHHHQAPGAHHQPPPADNHHVHNPQQQARPASPPSPPAAPSPAIVQALRLSGWYYEGLTYLDSQELLKERPLGTFIVRDSSDPRFLFSLSVQTERGPTSVRIHYVDGAFRLDAQQDIQAMMPVFPGVIELVVHYVEQSTRSQANPHHHVWVDPKGKMYSPITLSRPLIKDGQAPPSLKHLARLSVNAALKKARATTPNGATAAAHTCRSSQHTISQLELPASVSEYLSEYPYSI